MRQLTQPDRSPGMDGIDYLVFRFLDQRFAFLIILNEIFSSGSFPNEWNKYAIFFIPKKESDKLQPISLAQCLLKLAERMLYNRISELVNRITKSNTRFAIRFPEREIMCGQLVFLPFGYFPKL